jgi:imidazolonepropionase-like amidohydrolase
MSRRWGWILFPLLGCGAGLTDSQLPPCTVQAPARASFALTGITVLSMDDGEPRAGYTLVVRDGRVETLGPVASTPVPAGVEAVAGCDRFVMPGLADMHAHVGRSDLGAYLSAGVTSVRNMWGYPELETTIAEIEAGTLPGPTIYSVSPGLDGLPVKWPHTQLVLQPTRARVVVDSLADAGWTTLKMYQDLSADVYQAIVAAAEARNLDFVGHVPHRVGLLGVLAAGQRSIEHLSGFELALNPAGPLGAFGWTTINVSAVGALVTATVGAGTWNCPTMALFAAYARGDRRIIDNRRLVLRALHRGGARLLIGTDAGIGVTIPGQSIHEELAEFVASGMSPYEALRAATADAAEFLGAADEFGRIATGLRADFLVLAENPFDDVANAQHPELVFVRGRVAAGPAAAARESHPRAAP